MVGSWLRTLRDEVQRQPGELRKFSERGMPSAPRGSIFVGAGDSYAAALAGFYASGGRCIALDPYTLASTPELAEGVEVFFVSVSGRTASNVAAASKVRRVARRTTAITADEGSRLAKITNEAVVLPMSYAPKTPGMLSFGLTLVAVLKIAGADAGCDFKEAFAGAERDAGRVEWGKGTTYFLGNSLGYPAALYAAAKTYELFGSRAHAELLEEFSHLELFSLGRSDIVNVFACFDPGGASDKLRKALGEQRYDCRVVPSRGSSDAGRLFHVTFAVQLATIDRARRSGLAKPRFLTAGGRLRASDQMIY